MYNNQQNENLEKLLAIFNTQENIDKLMDVLNTHSKKQKTMEDWYDEFEKAEKLGVFPSDVEASAMNWGCCAIGSRIQKENPELARMLAQETRKNKIKVPITDEASKLGVEFYEAVRDNQVTKAREIFKAIHELPRIFKTFEEINDKKPEIIELEQTQQDIKAHWWKKP